jgi:hypothetical protein
VRGAVLAIALVALAFTSACSGESARSVCASFDSFIAAFNEIDVNDLESGERVDQAASELIEASIRYGESSGEQAWTSVAFDFAEALDNGDPAGIDGAFQWWAELCDFRNFER